MSWEYTLALNGCGEDIYCDIGNAEQLFASVITDVYVPEVTRLLISVFVEKS